MSVFYLTLVHTSVFWPIVPIFLCICWLLLLLLSSSFLLNPEFFPTQLYANEDKGKRNLTIFPPTILHVYKTTNLTIFPPTILHVYKSTNLTIFPPTILHVYKSTNLTIFPPTILHVHKSTNLTIFPRTILHVHKSTNLTIFPPTILHVYKCGPQRCLWMQSDHGLPWCNNVTVQTDGIPFRNSAFPMLTAMRSSHLNATCVCAGCHEHFRPGIFTRYERNEDYPWMHLWNRRGGQP